MTKFIKLSLALGALVLAAALMSACGDDDSDSSPDAAATQSNVDLDARCPGPQDHPAASPDELELSGEEISRVQEGNYTAAITWAGPGPWYAAVDKGFDAALDEFNIERVATAQAEYDPGEQAAQVDAVMAKDPDVVLGSPVDADAAATAYRDVVKAGKVLVLSDNVPTGYQPGKEYVGFVSGNRCEGGKLMADQIADAIGGSGEIGMIYFDANYYVTNVLDEYFKASIEERYPEIDIVAEEGFTKENATEDIASAMIAQNPNIEAIYVTWSIPAEGVMAALRAAGKSDVKVVTHDLNPTNDVNLAEGEGPMAATVVEDLQALGYNLGVEAAYGLLDKEAPPFVAVPYIEATPDTIVAAYEEAEGKPAPSSVQDAASGG